MPLSRLLVGVVLFLAFVVALGTLAGKCPELGAGPSPTRVGRNGALHLWAGAESSSDRWKEFPKLTP